MRRFVAMVVVICACKGKEAPRASERAPEPPPAAPADAATAAVAVDAGTDTAGLQALTEYAVKLRAVPAAIRAAKKPPKVCAPADLSAAGGAKASAITLQTLDQIAGNEVNWNLDPTFFQIQLETQDVSDVKSASDVESGKRKTPLNIYEPATKIRRLLVVTRPTKLYAPQLANGNRYWPGNYKGTVYVVDSEGARVLCAAPFGFASPKSLDMITTSLKDTRTGQKTAISSDVPEEKLATDFANRGRAALLAALAKIAPGVEIYMLRS